MPPTGLAAHRFRADIQGIRALAVLSVLLFHAGLPWLPGGYVGVDVFFVISGFLITGLLIKEISRTGGVGLTDFYVRRVRRILPAALVVIALTLAAGWALLPLSRWESLGWTGLWAALSVANWSLAADSTDYFNADAPPSPLQHYWSLGVEEQYYLVWPLLLVVFVAFALRRRAAAPTGTDGRPRRRAARQAAPAAGEPALDPRAVAIRVLLVAAVVSVVSLVHSVLYTPQNPGAAYFITTTRAWELGVGAALAALVVLLPALPARLRVVLGWTGLAMVLAAVVVFTEETVFPGYKAAVPVVGSALMILAGTHAEGDRHGAGVGTLLSSRPARWVGDLSYSLYLVHWPVIAIASWRFAEGLPLWLGLVLAAASVPVAWLLRIAVEKPFMGAHSAAASPTAAQTRAEARRRRRRGTLRPLLAGGLATAGVCALALALAFTAAQRTALPDTEGAVAGVGAAGAGIATDEDPEPGPADGTTAAGSNRAEPLASAEDTEAEEPASPPEGWDPMDELAGLSVDQIVPAPSSGSRDGSPLLYRDCQVEAADDTAKRCEDGDPDADTTVLLVGDSHVHHWSEAIVDEALERGWNVVSYVKGACPITTHTVELSEENGGPRPFTECTSWNEKVIKEVEAEQADVIITSASFYRDADGSSAADGMAEGWKKLVAHADHTVVLADPPHASRPVPECVERHSDDIAACSWDREEGLADSGTPDILAAAEQVPEVEVIDLNDFICPGPVCAPVVGNALVYMDSHHMTATFSHSLDDALWERLDRVIAD
ncbi:acyltransferase [Micrococcus lylae]|uniref:acyltransferase family protein n=1 Tax=Micrococcus lylae TaxID=1273 RepID=UPI0021A47DBD|nr:acyltransferase family protein [Micrococcus lylae]MCT2007297.1 acyltransferase [Micrococcus lylae]MCT2071029.1 acyltransferase [Micrococcus lylae]